MKGQDPALGGGGWPVRQISAKSLWPPKLSDLMCETWMLDHVEDVLLVLLDHGEQDVPP